MAKRHSGHLFKRGNVFYCFWRVNGRAFSKALFDKAGKHITTKRKAKTAQAALMASFVVSDEVSALASIAAKLEDRKDELVRIEDRLNPPLSIAKAWDAFLQMPDRPDSGESTLRQYQFQFDQFEAWMKERHADKVALRDVTGEIVAEYAAHLFKRGVSPNTYNKHLNLLTLVFRVLTDKAKLTKNTWQNIQRKRLVPQGRRELTIEELKKVCESATGEMRLLLALGVFCGLRLGDCATLRWCEVDLQRGIIRRIPMKTARRNSKPVLIPIHSTLRMLLGEVPPGKRSEYVLPETVEQYQRHADTVTDRIQAHFKNCGISIHKPGTGQGTGQRAVVEVGHHSLRHSFVSLCRASNAPLAVVEAIVGHSNPAMTRHYTHVGEAAAIAAVNSLPAIMGETMVVPAKPMLPPASPLEQFKTKVRDALEHMNTKNWQTVRTEMLAIVGAEKREA